MNFLGDKFLGFAEKYKTTFPNTTTGSVAKERFRSQIRSEGDLGDLEKAIENYRKLLDAESWRKPKTSFESFLGTRRSGFFWRDFVVPITLVESSEPRSTGGWN